MTNQASLSTACRRLPVWCLLLLGCASTAWAASKPLQVYFIDVEGGQATLFVTPAGKSLLIDTGWAGNNGLYADRIVAAAKDAGISKNRRFADHPLSCRPRWGRAGVGSANSSRHLHRPWTQP